MKKVKNAIISVLAPVLVLVVLFGLWQYLCVKNEIPKWLLPSRPTFSPACSRISPSSSLIS